MGSFLSAQTPRASSWLRMFPCVPDLYLCFLILLWSRNLIPRTSSGNLQLQISCSHICHHSYLTSLSLSNFIIKIKIAASPQQICNQRETVLGAAGFGILCQRHKSAVNRYYWFVSSVGVGVFVFFFFLFLH